MKNQFLQIMFEFCRQAGRIAIDTIEHSEPGLKSDHSVITLADNKISALAHTSLAGLITTGEHVLIEEEDSSKAKHLETGDLERVPYIWSVDPIDGTRLYANQIPLYGISIGLVRDMAPWMGMVYFPGQEELLYCDGDKSFYTQWPFTDEAVTSEIKKVNHEISSRSLFFVSDVFFKYFDFDYSDCRIMATGCATVNLCWPVLGRGCGSMDQSHLWDFAGTWPILRSAGMDLRHCRTGEVMDKIDPEKFCKSPAWKLKDYYIVSTEKTFPILRNKILLK